MQVESRCEPRKLVRTPQKGQLPLPADLDEASLNFAPSRVEDLNKVVPEGAPRLSTPQEHPNVSPNHCVRGRPHRPSAPFMHDCRGFKETILLPFRCIM